MMKLNPNKCKNLVFNFTHNNQFTTALKVNNHDIETVKEAKLLGQIITDDLKWERNTEEIVKSCNKRMRILHKASKFTGKISDLKIIYTYRALICYWDHLKNFIAEIPPGPLGMSIGTIRVTQKRFQGPPARGF